MALEIISQFHYLKIQHSFGEGLSFFSSKTTWDSWRTKFIPVALKLLHSSVDTRICVSTIISGTPTLKPMTESSFGALKPWFLPKTVLVWVVPPIPACGGQPWQTKSEIVPFKCLCELHLFQIGNPEAETWPGTLLKLRRSILVIPALCNIALLWGWGSFRKMDWNGWHTRKKKYHSMYGPDLDC